MIEQWKQLIWDVARHPTLAVSGVRKIASDVSFEIPGDQLTPGLNYTDLCYTAAKGRQLMRNYWNQEEADAAVSKLLSRRGKDHSSVSIQLRGQEKDSRSQGYCMQNMVITVTPMVSYVDIYYRSTELIQKFLADLIFFSKTLPPIFGELGIEPEAIRFKFANVYLSAMFMPIFLRYEDDPRGFFEHLRKHDPRFYRTCGRVTRQFCQETHNYTYRSRVKMFEYWKEHVDQKKVKSLGTMLATLKGKVPVDEEDEE